MKNDFHIRNDLVWHPSDFPPPERDRILESLPMSLARAAASWPDAAAVLYGGETYSFHDLACRSAGLSEEIDQAAERPGPVALVQSVGFDAIAAWFACSLSGRPFILLEPDHPPSRLEELVETAGCALVLTDHRNSKKIPNPKKAKTLVSDGRIGTLPLGGGLAADEPAMIFPTSGSTGIPKLIAYSATTLQVKVRSSIQLMHVAEGARVVIAGSHGNYGFLHHALVFLFSGGSVCLADMKTSGFVAVLDAIDRLGARHARFTPSVFRKFAALTQNAGSLRLLESVRFSGEPLLANDLKLALSVLNPGCLIQNVYGSTESALFIWSSDEDRAAGSEPTVPIGRIYPLSSYAIVPQEDSDGENSLGELLIRSAYHALGDVKEGMIDRERFPPIEGSDERVYATGDIVRKLPDGSLLQLGRTSRMVKIRGNRVFPLEVENLLRTIPGVEGAAIVEQGEGDETTLHGFITTDGQGVTADEARTWLSERLPEFMLPKSIETVSHIPLLAGGKVDHRALLDLIPKRTYEIGPKSPPRDDYTVLSQLWDSVLWEGAHRQDADFLALGGDSILLMRLAAEAERIFGKRLSMEELRANATIRKTADLLGIETPQTQSQKQYERIHARLFWKGTHPSRGIALVMPSFLGTAFGMPFKQSGLFSDHDLWIAEFPLKKGTMLESRRWTRAAFEIAERIREGAIPTPRVIVGFSYGGGLAWLVSRLLAGTNRSPAFVIMADAPALHRMACKRSREIMEALGRNAHAEPPPTLHLRRSPLPNGGSFIQNTNAWKDEDKVSMYFDLPTVEHRDLASWKMLALCGDAVDSFLNGGHPSGHRKDCLQPPDTLGVQLYRAVHGERDSLRKVMDMFAESPGIFSLDQWMTLFFLTEISKDLEKTNDSIRQAVKKIPDSLVARYIHRRAQRRSNMLLPGEIPCIFPPWIAALETNMAMSRRPPDRPIPRSIKLLFLSLDATAAILAANWEKSMRRRI